MHYVTSSYFSGPCNNQKLAESSMYNMPLDGQDWLTKGEENKNPLLK